MFIQYHLDENVNPAVARGRRNRGIDVTTTVETGMNGASDEEPLAYALSAGRVTVTHDADRAVVRLVNGRREPICLG